MSSNPIRPPLLPHLGPWLAAALAVAIPWASGCDKKSDDAAQESGEDPGTAKPEKAAAPAPVQAETEPPAADEAPEPTAAEKDEQRKQQLLQPPADVGVAPTDADKHARGVLSKQMAPGAGSTAPAPDDTVWLEYTAWSATGEVVDSSIKRGAPKKTRVKKLNAGWQPVVEAMREGERRRAWIPEKLAYTRNQRAKGLEGVLTIDFEVVKLAIAPKAPDDVSRPPGDAKLTASGLAYKVLAPGEGDERPTRDSEVTVTYAGWQTDGECFDFTPEGESTSFRLNGVIAGWTEGLQLMTPKQKMRFWIPEKLAYGGEKGRPEGMLVFDVQLLEISKP